MNYFFCNPNTQAEIVMRSGIDQGQMSGERGMNSERRWAGYWIPGLGRILLGCTLTAPINRSQRKLLKCLVRAFKRHLDNSPGATET